MKYGAILFDMDGVILDSEPAHFAAFRKVLENHGMNLSEEGYKKYFAGKTDKQGFEQYFSSLSAKIDVNKFMDHKTCAYSELAADRLAPFPSTIQIIKKLQGKIPLALVTGSLRPEAEIALGSLSLETSFNVMICAEDIHNGKPDPEGYNKAVSILGIERDKCVVIEDSPNGVLAAKKAGITCIAVTTTHTPNELREASAVVHTLSADLFE